MDTLLAIASRRDERRTQTEPLAPELVLRLLERRGVLVHPGYFFDFPREAFLVVSLLPEPGASRAGVARVLEDITALGGVG